MNFLRIKPLQTFNTADILGVVHANALEIALDTDDNESSDAKTQRVIVAQAPIYALRRLSP